MSSATLLIEIDGTHAGEAHGFNIFSSNNVLMGLVINRFEMDGIRIYGSNAISNTVSGNYIGTDARGLQDPGYQAGGVYVQFSSHNLIGPDSPGDRNVISGNDTFGVHLHTQTAENTVSGNYIGLNANGAGILPNKSEGVVRSSLAHGNLIGGDTAGERNIISGNGGDGVAIFSRAISCWATISEPMLRVRSAAGMGRIGRASRFGLDMTISLAGTRLAKGICSRATELLARGSREAIQLPIP